MGLYGLIEACILFVNSLAVLHEERFLQKVGWGSDQVNLFVNFYLALSFAINF